ncbi:hypothetical protein CCACVL1_18267 [Corchorus capsularis]|uniref:Uncharacterized protein n=1 Tax=Corchorus capsularis TaxID=210143 RepID=A0A1R3HM46_COCAP|nr:hypothetical protein CCACVL1_18267 [Corchorus capsularis]
MEVPPCHTTAYAMHIVSPLLPQEKGAKLEGILTK